METMGYIEIIATILGSGVLSAIIAAMVSSRVLYADNVTKERAKWRDRIRIIASEYPLADDKAKKELEIELITRLNPFDIEDIKILDSLKKDTDTNDEFQIRISLLMKHDWERAKNDSKIIDLRMGKPVKRVNYSQYLKIYKHYRDGDEKKFKYEIERLTRDEY